MKTWFRYALPALAVALAAFLPLVRAFSYEMALCLALIGLVGMPCLAGYSRNAGPGRVLVQGFGLWLWGGLWGCIAALSFGELCDIRAGWAYLLVLALPGVWLSGAAWFFVGRLVARHWLRVLIYAVLVLFDLGAGGLKLLMWPQMVSFGQFYGFFAGSIYDEGLDILGALALYRVGTLALIVTALGAGAWPVKPVVRVLCAGCGIVAAMGWHGFLAWRGDIVPSGYGAIQKALWAEAVPDNGLAFSSYEVPFRIHFMPRHKDRASIDAEKGRLLRAYESDYRALREFFQTEPSRPFRVWLYPDSSAKGELLGSKHTSLARVWTHEIHLLATGLGSGLARHEMAHLFAASFADSPLGLAGGRLVPVMGWVEGLAMAAQWPMQQYDLHTWSAAILKSESLGMKSIDGYTLMVGFWGLPSRIAYTLAGSYVRWLLDRFGLQQIKRLSNSGFSDYPSIVGMSFEATIDAWRHDLTANHSVWHADRVVDLVYSGISIWTRRCARAMASKREAFWACMGRAACGPEEAEAFFGAGNLDLDSMWALYRHQDPMSRGGAGLWEEVSFSNRSAGAQRRLLLDAIARALSDDSVGRAARWHWAEVAIDILWHADFWAVSHAAYKILRMPPLPAWHARRLDIKIAATGGDDRATGEGLRRYFASPHAEAAMLPHGIWRTYFGLLEAVANHDPDAVKAILAALWAEQPVSALPDSVWHEIARIGEMIED